jgi:hypothetical protein
LEFRNWPPVYNFHFLVSIFQFPASVLSNGNRHSAIENRQFKPRVRSSISWVRTQALLILKDFLGSCFTKKRTNLGFVPDTFVDSNELLGFVPQKNIGGYPLPASKCALLCSFMQLTAAGRFWPFVASCRPPILHRPKYVAFDGETRAACNGHLTADTRRPRHDFSRFTACPLGESDALALTQSAIANQQSKISRSRQRQVICRVCRFLAVPPRWLPPCGKAA